MKPAFSPRVNSGRVEPFHETRKHFLHQAGARSQLFREAILDETRERVVETVREGERRPAFAVRAAAAGADVFEKIVRRSRRRRFRESRANKDAAVIVGTADEDFFPRLGMGRLKPVALGKLGDFFGRELCQEMLREVAKQGIAQAVDAFEMLEEQDQALQMRGRQLAIDAVKRVGNGVGESPVVAEKPEGRKCCRGGGRFQCVAPPKGPRQGC